MTSNLHKKTEKDNVTLLSEHKNHQVYTSEINCFKQGMPGRVRLEKFINDVYKKYYDTEINKFYPTLLAIESKNIQRSSIKAVAGIRSAEHEALFSEYYLSQTLEETLFNTYNTPISRHTIVEVGNLAPANIGQMRWLNTSITAFLYSAGFKYIIFTGVPSISNAFKRMNLPLKVLAEAKQSCLPQAIKDKWGKKYYESKPMVFSGNIEQGYEIVKNMIYNSKHKNHNKLIPLFERSIELGQQFRHEANLLVPDLIERRTC